MESLTRSVEYLKSSLENLDSEVSLRVLDPAIDRFINDEETIKGDELAEERKLTVTSERFRDKLPIEQGESRTVYAIDTSSILLGECRQGIIFAIRGVTVKWEPLEEKCSIICKFEVPCYVSRDNKQKVYNSLRKELWGIRKHGRAPDVLKMVDRVRNIYERYLQLQLAKETKDSILLFDGSLRGGTIDTPVKILRKVLKDATSNNSDVISFSKKTTLLTKEGEHIINLPINEPDVPTIIPVSRLISKGQHQSLGEIYIVKLCRLPLSFRVDIHSPRSHGKVFGDLLVSVFLESGYPKPLIQAHVYCYFNAFDAMGIQAYLAKRGIIMRKEFDVRRLLFGIYGGL